MTTNYLSLKCDALVDFKFLKENEFSDALYWCYTNLNPEEYRWRMSFLNSNGGTIQLCENNAILFRLITDAMQVEIKRNV